MRNKMPEREPPDWEILKKLLAELAGQERGEVFLQCVRSRVHGPANNWPLEKIAMAAYDRGGLSLLFDTTKLRLIAKYGTEALDAVLHRERLMVLLRLEERAFAELHDEVNRKLFDLTRDATVVCAERAPLLGPAPT